MNSELRIIRNVGFLFSLTLVTVLGCSLKRGDSNNDLVGLTIQYNPPKDPPARMMNSDGIESTFGALTFSTTPTPTPPTSISGFNCLVVNVVGNGIAPQKSFNVQNPAAIDGLVSGLLSGQSCSYPGVMSAPFSASSPSTQSITVPSGSSRIIQIVGMQSDSGGYCTTGQFDGSVRTYAYELGRSVINLLKDTSVSIASSYSAANANSKSVACEGPSGGGGTTSFDPNSITGLTIWYQGGELLDSVDNPVTPVTSGNLTDNWRLKNKSTNAANPNFANVVLSINSGHIPSFFSGTDASKGFNLNTNDPTSPSGQTRFTKEILYSTSASDIVSFFGNSSTQSQFTAFFVADVPINSLTSGQALGLFGISATNSGSPFDPAMTNDYFYLEAKNESSVNKFKVVFRSANASTAISETAINAPGTTFNDAGGTGKLIHILRYDGTNMRYRILGNGSQEVGNVAASGFKILNSLNHRIHIGTIEVSGSTAKPFKGAFMELLFVKSALSAAVEGSIVDYLKSRHNITTP